MTLPVTDVGFDDVNVELRRAATNYVHLNETAVRNLAGKTSGQIGISDLQGKQFRIKANLNLTTNNQNVYVTPANLQAWGLQYIAGITDVTITVASGVHIGSASTSAYAMQITGFTTGDTVHLINNYYIIGRGGNGGSAPSGSGGGGGPALYVNFPTKITNNGVIAGGGGGGGASANTTTTTPKPPTPTTTHDAGDGGGGGAGYTAGSGGSGTTFMGVAGSPGAGGGTYSGGSGGGTAGPGGPLGNYGTTSSGGGGAPGYYVVGIGHVTWLATGTRAGLTG